MLNVPNAAQADLTKEFLLSGKLSSEEAVQQLTNAGWDQPTAYEYVNHITNQHRKELFDRAMKRDNNEQTRGVLLFVAFMITVIGPIFEMRSAGWNMAVLIVLAVLGYFAFKDKPAAGVIAFALFGILFPLAYNQYFANRTSYIRIEMLIPVAMAAIPAVVVLWIISKIFYREY